MGMRRNIKLVYETSIEANDKALLPSSNCIYLYTHWGAEGLENTLAESLKRAKSRWDDESYLARIIMTDMMKDAGESLTGYGIAPYCMDDEYPTLTVNMAKNTVNDVPYEDFIAKPSMFPAFEPETKDSN